MAAAGESGTRIRTVVAIVGVAAALAGLTATVLVGVTALPFYRATTAGPVLPLLVAAAWLLFAAAVVGLRFVPLRAAITLVVVGAVAVGGAALAGPPNTSTDSARYAWDGIVQNAGISPYRYVPTDPALEPLRQDWLFPDAVAGPDGAQRCAGPRIQTSREPGTSAGDPDSVVCTALNRGTVHTIYPPAAELVFAGVRAVVGPEAQYWPLQVLGLLLSLATTATLLLALRRRGLDPRWAALFAWCPLVASEAVTNSHIDALGALFLLAGTLAAGSGHGIRSGIGLGLAMSAKLIPVIGTPALVARRPIRVIVTAAVVFLLLYVPYVIASGIGVLGYLPGYLNEEGYDSGTRFVLISPWAPGRAAFVVAAVLLAITAFLVWRKTPAGAPWLGQTVMIGVTLIVVSPRYPWYALLLVPMVAMSGRWEWLAVGLALSARQLVPHPGVLEVSLLVAVALIVVVSVRRAGPGSVRRAAGELRHPWRRPADARAPGARADASPSLAS